MPAKIEDGRKVWIRNVKMWEEWEAAYQASQPVDYQRNLKIYQAMLDWASQLGVLPLKYPLEGIEHKVELARRLNISKDG